MPSRSLKKTGSMPKISKISLYLILIILAFSGFIWLYLDHFVRVNTEFGGATHHPIEYKMLVTHGISAYLFIFLFGVIWNDHIKKWFKVGKKNFRSGIFMASTIATLALSGLILYYPTSDELREIVSVIHWALGIALFATFLFHAKVKIRSIKS